jgi:two-component system sensor histidine kinase DegS
MTITDNGKGIPASELPGDLARQGKLGVLGMQERALLIGGNLEIKSELGKGTIVVIEAPVQKRA